MVPSRGGGLGLTIGKTSRQGSRPGKVRNEDSIDIFATALGQVLLVADGMGGHGHGDLASAIVASSFHETLVASTSLGPQEALNYALQIAHSRIQQTVEQNDLPRGVGSTVVAAIIAGDTVYYGHVGDSRLYLYRGRALHQITRDHSLVQGEIDAGRLTEEQALVDSRASSLTRAVGATENVTLEAGEPLALQNGDALLLCSDGIHGYMDRTAILFALEKNLESAQKVADALANMAAGTCNSDDDISTIFAQYGTPQPVGPAPVFSQGRSEELLARRAARPVESAHAEPHAAAAPLPLPIEGRPAGDFDEIHEKKPGPPVWLIVLLVVAGAVAGGWLAYRYGTKSQSSAAPRPAAAPPIAGAEKKTTAQAEVQPRQPAPVQQSPAQPAQPAPAPGTSQATVETPAGSVRVKVIVRGARGLSQRLKTIAEQYADRVIDRLHRAPRTKEDQDFEVQLSFSNAASAPNAPVAELFVNSTGALAAAEEEALKKEKVVTVTDIPNPAEWKRRYEPDLDAVLVISLPPQAPPPGANKKPKKPADKK